MRRDPDNEQVRGDTRDAASSLGYAHEDARCEGLTPLSLVSFW